MAGLFISYRREDSAGFAGRLADALEARFASDQVFRDVDDIQPGEDFVAAIHDRLRAMDAVLVLIGPRWLTAVKDGARRLDDPRDFVRLEIDTALELGKPVIPVLVGGETMPAEQDLPEPLRALARRQAFNLSDAAWKADVARLVEALGQGGRGGGRRGLIAGLAAAGLLALLAAVWFAGPWRRAPDIASELNGRWTAQVKYDWGDEHREVFEFEIAAGELHGTASYLGGRLAIEEGRVEERRITFVTRSREMLSGHEEDREVIHRYRGVLAEGEIRFTLESGGGFSLHAPVHFVARRHASAPVP